MAGLDIRRAEVEDADAVAAVHVGAWQAAYRGLLPAAYLEALRPEHRRDGWAQTFATGPTGEGATFLAVRDGTAVVGFADVRASRDDDADRGRTGELTSLYVAPAHWGSGIGRALMTRAVAWLHEAGFQDATLWVLSDNRRARRFYERAGWREDGAMKHAVVAGADVVEVRYRHAAPASRGSAECGA